MMDLGDELLPPRVQISKKLGWGVRVMVELSPSGHSFRHLLSWQVPLLGCSGSQHSALIAL